MAADHEHAAHGPIVSEDAQGNTAIDFHGWGHPLPLLETPLLDRVRREPASGAAEPWSHDFLVGVQQRAASRAIGPAEPLIAAARVAASLPNMNCHGEAYQRRKDALGALRAAVRDYDEATR